MGEKDRIEKIMQLENMNSAQFAMETGIQTSTLSHILNGRNKVSLDVLKKILNRFRTISSDWLILGVGSMYRQEKNSQAPTLFDSEYGNTYKSTPLLTGNNSEIEWENSINQRKPLQYAEADHLSVVNPVLPPIIDKPSREIKKIIVYYTDNSFQEFIAG